MIEQVWKKRRKKKKKNIPGKLVAFAGNAVVQLHSDRCHLRNIPPEGGGDPSVQGLPVLCLLGSGLCNTCVQG